ncbi:MAG TPA: hypothetical protein VNI83_04950, partial [Vicinamibacterales bacterium]|nr:hypothetical protein [Vicinamibacterales bacterium]
RASTEATLREAAARLDAHGLGAVLLPRAHEASGHPCIAWRVEAPPAALGAAVAALGRRPGAEAIVVLPWLEAE